MKKTICVLLSFILIITSSVYVLANKSTDTKEILFRDIPWGSDIDTALDTITEVEMKRFSPDRSNGFKTDFITKKEILCTKHKNTCMYCSNPAGTTINVAGYDMSSMTMYFAIVYNDETADLNNSTTSFYGASYYLETKEVEKASEDLVNKLSALYGDYEDISNSEFRSLYQWTGANDTVVTMETDEEFDTIVLGYAWLGGDKLLDQADELVAKKSVSKRRRQC